MIYCRAQSSQPMKKRNTEKNKIQDDLKEAMLAKDEAKLSTIRMLKSAIQY